MKYFLTFLIILQFLFATSSVSAKEFSWVKYAGKIPASAKWIGMEERLSDGTYREFAICRGDHKEVSYPGRLVGSECIITYKGDEVKLQQFEVFLHGNSVKFAKYKPGNLPKTIVSAGGAMDNLLYVCSAKHKHYWFPGKLEDKECKIAYKGKEIVFKDNFFVLAAKKKS